MGKGLSLKVRLGYGICDLGGNLFFTMMGFYLLYFMTDVVGLAAGLAGTALMVGKIWDAITDPAVGYLSDRTRTRWDAGGPGCFWGAFAPAVSMTVEFTNPGLSSQGLLFVWAALAYCLLCTAYTLVNIPYGALLPELTTNSTSAPRSTATGCPLPSSARWSAPAVVLPIVKPSPTQPRLGVTGAAMGAVMMATAMITFAAVREDPSRQPADAGTGVVRRLSRGSGHRVFLLALFPWVLHITGVTIIQGALLYYFKYIFEAEGQFQIALIFLLVTALVFIPIWVAISRRIGKKLCYNLGHGPVRGRRGRVLSVRRARRAHLRLRDHDDRRDRSVDELRDALSIIPDVVEHDYAETGRRREGVYYGVWTFASKVGQALAIALNGWMLAAFGYQPDRTQTALSPSWGSGCWSGRCLPSSL